MTDRVQDRDGTFSWGKECPDRYEIKLYFSNGVEYEVPKYVKEILCSYADLNVMTLEDYIWSKPQELERSLYKQTLDNLVKVEIRDKNDYMDRTLQRFVDKSVNKYLDKRSNLSKEQAILPESKGHAQIKNEVVNYLNKLGLEAYPEVIFYENALSDFYGWQERERRSKPDADGTLGFGSVGFGNYKQEYGQQIRVDVAGWITDYSRGEFLYPLIAVEIMYSSSLREEVMSLQRIHGRSAVYAVIVDALGQLYGEVSGIPVVSLDTFKRGIIKRIELVKDAINSGKDKIDIIDIGIRFNSSKYGPYD
jgi:hypothetical protein